MERGSVVDAAPVVFVEVIAGRKVEEAGGIAARVGVSAVSPAVPVDVPTG